MAAPPVLYRIGKKIEDGDESVRFSRKMREGEFDREFEDRLRNLSGPNGRFQIRTAGNEFSARRTMNKTVNRTIDLLDPDTDHDFVVVRDPDHDRYQFVIRRVIPDIVLRTPGTPAIDVTLGALKEAGLPYEIWGICSCRNIGNTSSISQHQNCNAADIHAGSHTGMQRIADFLYRNRARLPISEIIWNHRLATKSQSWTWRYYNVPPGGSPHLDHVHVSGSPLIYARPGSACR